MSVIEIYIWSLLLEYDKRKNLFNSLKISKPTYSIKPIAHQLVVGGFLTFVQLLLQHLPSILWRSCNRCLWYENRNIFSSSDSFESLFVRIQYFLSYVLMIMTFTGCNINGFVGSVAALSEIWSLSAVSFDRFKCVHNPLNRSKRIKTSEVKISILLVIKSQLNSFHIR